MPDGEENVTRQYAMANNQFPNQGSQRNALSSCNGIICLRVIGVWPYSVETP